MTYSAAALVCALIASGYDIRERRIPNLLTVPSILAGLLLHGILGGWSQLGSSALAGLIGGLIFVVFYQAGGMGAGDVKLMIAVGCLMGLPPLHVMLLVTSLAGAGLGLAIAIYRRRLRQTLANVASIAAHHSREGLPLALAGGAIFGVIPSAYIFWRRSHRVAVFSSALPEAIDMMARALRAGHSMAAAIEMVSADAPEPVASEFGEVFRQQNFGLPLRDALMQMLDKVPSQDLRVLVTAIIVQRDTGGNLIELLDRSAFLIRDRIRLRGEIRTHTAQGRMTGWVLCALPVAMLVLINIVNPGYSSILFSDPFGRKLIYGGIALLAVGSFIINRIVNGIDL